MILLEAQHPPRGRAQAKALRVNHGKARPRQREQAQEISGRKHRDIARPKPVPGATRARTRYSRAENGMVTCGTDRNHRGLLPHIIFATGKSTIGSDLRGAAGSAIDGANGFHGATSCRSLFHAQRNPSKRFTLSVALTPERQESQPAATRTPNPAGRDACRDIKRPRENLSPSRAGRKSGAWRRSRPRRRSQSKPAAGEIFRRGRRPCRP